MTIIIQVRGTSGSGKTHVMRRVMDLLGEWQGVTVEGRRKPLYYRTAEGSEWGPVAVLGHYEATCGGCDNIGAAPKVYEAVQTVEAAMGRVPVLMEGLLLSEDTKWTHRLYDEGHDLYVLFLTTDVERCVEQIKSRRAAAGNEKELNEDNTRNRVVVIERARLKLSGNWGINVRRTSSGQAPQIITSLLRCAAEGRGHAT